MACDRYRRRNSLRRTGHDYAQPGAVFVTICASGRQRLFGRVESGCLVHSAAGVMASESWRSIPNRFVTVAVDTFVVMPDHIHGIVMVGTIPDDRSTAIAIGDVVRWFKSTVHAEYRHGVLQLGWMAYDRHLWQRGYHDRIIRTDREAAHFRRYIEGNPTRWSEREETAGTGREEAGS